ncbi:MAG TPA: hypothetical protein VGC66_15865 [Pyrinomonadaceae bacterium]|jgi:hypothetical protein
MTTQAGNRRIAPLARVLAFVLLVFVTYSATLEIVHGHGQPLPVKSSVTASFHGANTDQSTTESSRSTGECLICQLHQQLFSTLLISVPGIAPPQTEETIAAHSFSSSPSEANTPQRGRAPPQASLL